MLCCRQQGVTLSTGPLCRSHICKACHACPSMQCKTDGRDKPRKVAPLLLLERILLNKVSLASRGHT